MTDMINRPPHYTRYGPVYEPANVIEAWDAGWHIGSAIAYLARAGHKDGAAEVDDLAKAVWFIRRRIQLLQARKSSTDTGGSER